MQNPDNKNIRKSLVRRRPFVFIFIGLFVLTVGGYYLRPVDNSWEVQFRNVGTNSSPRTVDLNGDGILDIVLGAGGEEYDTTDYAVMALDGRNGKLLWRVSGPNQVVGSAVFKDITQDGVPDVFIGGRTAQLYAIDGRTGKILWQFLHDYTPTDLYTDTVLLNFFNPQFIPDQNGDGVEDIIAAFGGFVHAKPYDPDRPPGQLLVLDALTGSIITRAYMPDGNETYMSPVVYDFGDGGGVSVLFGTGGETLVGNFYRIRLNDLMTTGMKNAVLIDSGFQKGFIAPPVLIDITQDKVRDIVITSMDGVMRTYDGSDFHRLWITTIHPRAEVQSMQVPLYFDDDDIPDFFGIFNVGEWPANDTTIHAIVSGKDGRELFRDTLGMLQSCSPVLLDYDEDSYYDVVYPVNTVQQTGILDLYRNQLMLYDGRTGKRTALDSVVYGKNLGSTPLIADLDQDGKVDIVYTFMTQRDQFITYRHLVVKRIELDIRLKQNPWGAYMGTNYTSVFP